jgi:hypothetical protein
VHDCFYKCFVYVFQINIRLYSIIRLRQYVSLDGGVDSVHLVAISKLAQRCILVIDRILTRVDLVVVLQVRAQAISQKRCFVRPCYAHDQFQTVIESGSEKSAKGWSD